MSAFSTPELQPYMVLAQEIMRRVYADEEPTDMHAWLTAQVRKLGVSDQGDAILTWAESFPWYDDLLAKRAERSAMPADQRRDVDWPWASWNNIIAPLDPGMLATITAGDGQGKTIYAECMAEHWARRGLNVAYLHFELNRAIMMDRRTVRHTGIDRRVLRDGQLSAQQRDEYQRSRERMQDWHGSINYVHCPGWSMESALRCCDQLRSEDVCDVVVLDYLEKIGTSQRQLRMYGASMFQREADNVEQLKNFGEASNVPVIMLAQLAKSGKRTDFQDLDRTAMRGAGEKSEKANVVVILHREQIDGGYSNAVQVKVDKNTMGPTCVFSQMMLPDRFDVRDMQ